MGQIIDVPDSGGGGGGVSGASNVGAGTGVWKDLSGSTLRFKSLVAGTNITLTPGADDITIDASGGGGGGTVTSVSVSTANGVSGAVANPTTTPAITLTLGAITPTSVAASGAVSGSNLSGTNTGDQTVNGVGGAAIVIDTDDVSEGATNLYFTDERAQDAVGNNVQAPLAYDDPSGAISIPQANGSTDGFLDSADWTAFNSKLSSVPQSQRAYVDVLDGDDGTGVVGDVSKPFATIAAAEAAITDNSSSKQYILFLGPSEHDINGLVKKSNIGWIADHAGYTHVIRSDALDLATADMNLSFCDYIFSNIRFNCQLVGDFFAIGGSESVDILFFNCNLNGRCTFAGRSSDDLTYKFCLFGTTNNQWAIGCNFWSCFFGGDGGGYHRFIAANGVNGEYIFYNSLIAGKPQFYYEGSETIFLASLASVFAGQTTFNGSGITAFVSDSNFLFGSPTTIAQEVQTLTFQDLASTGPSDYIVIYDTTSTPWAVALDTTGTDPDPTGADWVAVAGSNKVKVDISAATSAADVAAAAKAGLNGLTGFTAAITLDDSAADGTMTSTGVSNGRAPAPIPHNADDTGDGSISGVETTMGASGTTFTYYSNAYGVNYPPANSSYWNVVPSKVDAALNAIANGDLRPPSWTVSGPTNGSTSTTDAATAAGTYTAASSVTTTGDITTIGVNSSATCVVAGGATNNKAVAGGVFNATRGDTTDDGTTSGLFGCTSLVFNNPGASGVTNTAVGYDLTTFASSGTIDNLYDFRSTHTGAAVVTNHYGLYITPGATQKRSWISGLSVFGGGSFTAPNNDTVITINEGHLGSIQAIPPTPTPDANAGTGATASVSQATDTAGVLELDLGTIGTLSSGVQVVVGFDKPYAVAPIVTITPNNADAAVNAATFGIFVTSTAGDFSINFATAGVALTTLKWNYQIIETQA